jgi:germination protein M
VVSSPHRGDTVHSPFHVSGTADTFEAVFRLQLRDAQGTVLLDQQVQATSGTGTRGGYDATVTTAARGQLTLVLFQRSAKDGSAQDTVSVPVTID